MKQLDTVIEQNERLYALLSKRLRHCCEACSKKRKSKNQKSVVKEPKLQKNCYTEENLMTIDMAAAELRVSRVTIYKLIKMGKLKKLSKDGRTRVISAEIMEAKKWYAIPKGKI